MDGLSTRVRVVATLLATHGGCAGNPIEAEGILGSSGSGSSSSIGASVDGVASQSGGSTDADSGTAAPPDLPAAGADTSSSSGGAAVACGDGVQEPGEWCWTPPVELIVTDILFDLDAGDIDGDGATDLVIATDDGLLPITHAGGVWTTEATLPITSTQVRVVRCGRLDGDAIDDVVATDDYYGVWRAFGSDLGLETPTQQGISETAGAFALGDIDADGDLDVVLGSAVYGSLMYLGGSDDGTLTLLGAPQIGWAATGVALGDLDDDRRLDTVATTLAPSLHVALFEPRTPGAPTLASYPSPAGRGSVTTGDFDGDGVLDVARVDHATGSVRLWRGEGGPLGESVDLAVSIAAHDVAAADFDADGDVDLVVLGDDEVVPLENQGDVQFALRDAVATPEAFVLRLADLDDDGVLDVIVAGAGGVRMILPAP